MGVIGMPSLKIQLFQSLEVRADDSTILDMGSPTSRSLFAFLVLRGQQAIDRRRLAFLFWPKGSEQAARRNLRQYLHRIRRSLESVDPDGKLLLAEGNSVRFCPPKDTYIDVVAFEAAASPPAEDLPQAIELYRGDLLEDVYDDWVTRERERLAGLYLECLQRLIDQGEAAQQYAEAIGYARRYLEADPLLETAYVRLMRLHYAAGDRGHVKQTYEHLVDTLRRELAATPLSETTAIYEAMLAGEYGNEAAVAVSIPEADSLPVAAKSSAPFVGRAAELNWLDRGLKAAAEAHGDTYFLQGESGVGKTRLMAEWLERRHRQALVLSGQGHEFESMIPYGLMGQALRQAINTIPWERFHPPPAWLSALVPLLPELPRYFPGSSVPEARVGSGFHVVEALGNLLFTLARQRPLVFYLDNLHWADTPTWNFLGYLAQRASLARMLVIGVARIEDMPPERQRLVRTLTNEGKLASRSLERLSQSETEELVCQLMPAQSVDPRFLRRIYEETEGNPFFIIETIQAVREAGGDWTESVPTDATGRRPHFAIPLQIQAVIESRLDMLGQESRSALGIGAAIGREFTFELLQEVSQSDTKALLDDLDEWLARGLVRETYDGYDFTHEKLSQVAYMKLSRARRQWVHFQIAERLDAHEDDVDPVQLAHHYYLSSDPARALPHLARAGERALAVRSYSEAREFGLRAIGLFGRNPNPAQAGITERIDINLQLAQAHAFTGAHHKALEILQETERMAETSGDMKRLARIFHRSAQVFWLRGQAATAGDYTRRTLRHAEEFDDPELRFAALRMMGRVGIVLSSYDDAIAYLLRYIDLAEHGTLPADLPAIYGYLGVAYARVGSWQRAIDAAQKGLEMAGAQLSGEMHVVARMQLGVKKG
jgi:DNA-binding SARP family transcriptional activator